MRHEHVSKLSARSACAVLAVLLWCAFVSNAQARNTIRWYDDQGNLHTIELSDLGPYEQEIQDKLQGEGNQTPQVDDGVVSQEAPAKSEKLEQQYEAIKAREQQRQDRQRIIREINSIDSQIADVDKQIAETEQQLKYKGNRRAGIVNREGTSIRLWQDILNLRKQLDLLYTKKQTLQNQKEALRQQMPPAP